MAATCQQVEPTDEDIQNEIAQLSLLADEFEDESWIQ